MPFSSDFRMLAWVMYQKFCNSRAENWLFCDTPNGAQASAIVYTMVEMAKANGVNVYHYLTYLLEHQPNDKMSDEKLEALAPWNESVKAEIAKCSQKSVLIIFQLS